MINLDNYSTIHSIDSRTKVATMQAGVRLRDLISALREHGLAMPTLGSIVDQSIAGAIATATHGSSYKHGILSDSVIGLKIMLSNGRTVSCSAEQNPDLFCAALVSLGALGIITEVSFKAVPAFNLSWRQDLVPLHDILSRWEGDLWTRTEFSRVWWFPYMKQCVHWRADKTHEPHRAPKASWFSGKFGYHVYHGLLYISQWFPSILPSIEKFVIAVQYGGEGTSGVGDGNKELLMNCLYSQFVNEWAIPLSKGPEAIRRLSSWLHGDLESSGIPFDSKGIYVHAPIEVRVANTLSKGPRAYLDNTMRTEPSLLLNATLYRPYDHDPPCHLRYYEAFQWLMKDLSGRPHWAKNFTDVSSQEFHVMYPELPEWLRIRNEVDPEGMFLGDWHRRYLLSAESSAPAFSLEEKRIATESLPSGGIMWHGEVFGKTLSPQNSEESFDLMHGAEAQKSVVLNVDE